MTYLLLMVLAVTPPEIYVETYDIDTPTYDEVLLEAIHNCRGVDPEKVDIKLLEELIEIEQEFNVPPKFRGMILAAACQESKYNPNAEGDHRFSKKKKPMAIGILQLWPIYEKMYPGLDRNNPRDAAIGWMKHIVKQIPKVKRTCGHRTDAKIWLAAWVTGVRYKKAGGRCYEAPKHHRVLRKWHRNIKIKRANGC